METITLSPEQLEVFRAILKKAGIQPGQVVKVTLGSETIAVQA